MVLEEEKKKFPRNSDRRPSLAVLLDNRNNERGTSYGNSVVKKTQYYADTSNLVMVTVVPY